MYVADLPYVFAGGESQVRSQQFGPLTVFNAQAHTANGNLDYWCYDAGQPPRRTGISTRDGTISTCNVGDHSWIVNS